MTGEDLYAAIPPFFRERIDAPDAGDAPLQGEFVLYWMRTAVRGHENPALDTAILASAQLGVPVFVYHAVSERYPYASDRHHTFILEGARDVAAELTERGVGYVLHVERNGHRGPHLKTLGERAALVVTEDMPVSPLRDWTRSLDRSLEAPVWQVDTAAVCPMLRAGKVYGSAAEFRKAMGGVYSRAIPGRWPAAEPYHPIFVPDALPFEAVNPRTMDIPRLVAECDIDHGVGPVPDTPGGSRAGYERWSEFRDGSIESYDRRRNNPVVDGVSRMSAYLHYGHVSPFRLAREAGGVGGEGAGKFLSELLVWRDLSYSFCKFRPEHDTVEALPSWARQTLESHEADPRDELLSWERLARAGTGDDLWDLAQQSLLAHGELHNNVRMTWGKALLKWTPDAGRALDLAVDLNHRYALDGRDPNSYQGILYCFGLFDRPSEPERPILGKVRSRDTAWQSTMIDMPGYRRKVGRGPVDHPPRILVVGAGVAGLSCARVLRDHNLEVQVVEKARGPGGRASTRRVGDLRFDHGAQYFTAKDPRFRRYVDSWLQDGVIAPWEGLFGTLEGGTFSPVPAQQPRYVGVPGMSAVARHLADGLDVRFQTRVEELVRSDDGWTVRLSDGAEMEADLVILAVPGPQAAELLEGTGTPLAAEAARSEMSPTWAGMLAFGKALDVDLDGARVTRGPIQWVAREGSRPHPATPPGRTWVFHAASGWSELNLERPEAELEPELLESFFQALGVPAVEPAFYRLHRWRYSRPIAPDPEGALLDAHAGIGLCGDWLLGDDLESAFLSGQAMAGRIMGYVRRFSQRSSRD